MATGAGAEDGRKVAKYREKLGKNEVAAGIDEQNSLRNEVWVVR